MRRVERITGADADQLVAEQAERQERERSRADHRDATPVTVTLTWSELELLLDAAFDNVEERHPCPPQDAPIRRLMTRLYEQLAAAGARADAAFSTAAAAETMAKDT